MLITPYEDAKRRWRNRGWKVECFAPRTTEAIRFAHTEAKRLNHSFVDTEHLLLGLIELGDGVAVEILKKHGLDIETARLKVERINGRSSGSGAGNVPTPFTSRANKVLLAAEDEARALKQTHISPEHVLLALMREPEGAAALILKKFISDLDGMRSEIIEAIMLNRGAKMNIGG